MANVGPNTDGSQFLSAVSDLVASMWSLGRLKRKKKDIVEVMECLESRNGKTSKMITISYCGHI